MRIRQLLLALMMVAAPTIALAVDDDDDLTPVAIPEPATLALLGAGVAAVIVARARNRK